MTVILESWPTYRLPVYNTEIRPDASNYSIAMHGWIYVTLSDEVIFRMALLTVPIRSALIQPSASSKDCPEAWPIPVSLLSYRLNLLWCPILHNGAHTLNGGTGYTKLPPELI